MGRKKGKLPPVKAKAVVLRSVGYSSDVSDVVIATETPVRRYDDERGCVISEVLLMEGVVLRANQNQIKSRSLIRTMTRRSETFSEAFADCKSSTASYMGNRVLQAMQNRR